MAWHLVGEWDDIAYDENAPYMFADIFNAINERRSLQYHATGMSKESALLTYQSLSIRNAVNNYHIANRSIALSETFLPSIGSGPDLGLPSTYSELSNNSVDELFIIFTYWLLEICHSSFGFVFPLDHATRYESLEHLCFLHNIRYRTGTPHCPFARCGAEDADVDHNPFNWYKSVINALTIMSVNSNTFDFSSVPPYIPYNPQSRVYNLISPFQQYDPGDGIEILIGMDVSDQEAYDFSRAATLASQDDNGWKYGGYVLSVIGNSYALEFRYVNPDFHGYDAVVYDHARHCETVDESVFMLRPNPYLAGSTLIDMYSEKFAIRIFAISTDFNDLTYGTNGPFLNNFSGDASLISATLVVDVYVNDVIELTVDASSGYVEIEVPIRSINFSVWPFETSDRIRFVPRWSATLPMDVSQDASWSIPYTASIPGQSHCAAAVLDAWRSPYLNGYIDISGAMTVA